MTKIQIIPFSFRVAHTLLINGLSYFFPYFSRFRGPFFLNWQISYACNAKCGFCNTHELTKQGHVPIDHVKIIEEIDRLGVCHLSITGGEPFLGNTIKTIVQALAGKNIYVNINTNGSLLHKHFDWIFDAHIDSLTISIDSADPEKHDQYRSIQGLVSTIKAAAKVIKERRKKGSLKIVFRCVINKMNYLELESMYRELLPYCDEMDFQPLHTTVFFRKDPSSELHLFSKQQTAFNFSKEDEASFAQAFTAFQKISKRFQGSFYSGFRRFIFDPYQFSQRFKCYTSFLYLTITPRGEIYPCTFMIDKVGNLESSSLSQIWSSAAMHEIRKNHKNGRIPCFCWCGIAEINNLLCLKGDCDKGEGKKTP